MTDEEYNPDEYHARRTLLLLVVVFVSFLGMMFLISNYIVSGMNAKLIP